jgi:hypothetical protein
VGFKVSLYDDGIDHELTCVVDDNDYIDNGEFSKRILGEESLNMS